MNIYFRLISLAHGIAGKACKEGRRSTPDCGSVMLNAVSSVALLSVFRVRLRACTAFVGDQLGHGNSWEVGQSMAVEENGEENRADR